MRAWYKTNPKGWRRYARAWSELIASNGGPYAFGREFTWADVALFDVIETALKFDATAVADYPALAACVRARAGCGRDSSQPPTR